MSNRHYDRLKWAVVIFLPALAVLVAGLMPLYPEWIPAHSVELINLVTVFLGAIIQVSSQDYQRTGGDR